MNIYIYTDGSCLGNPGPGGWAAILRYGAHEKGLVGGAEQTTNNRMELTAVIEGLQALKRRDQACPEQRRRVKVVTDSQYVATILNNGRAKANRDLVQQLRQLSQQHDVIVQWVRGHSGCTAGNSAEAMNERCDRLAVAAAKRFQAQGSKPMCQITNFKRYGSIWALNQAFGDRWAYIGRANSYAGLPQSPLANPFRVKDFGGRGKTLPHYRYWLWERIQAGDTAVLEALRAIDESSVLVCYCKPGPCHGDVVKAEASWLRTVENRDITRLAGHKQAETAVS